MIFALLATFIIISFLKWTRTLPIRIGYFADKITEDEFGLKEIININVKTKNCITYLLESNNEETIKVYVSAGRSTDINNYVQDSQLNVNIKAEVETVNWYVQLFIPGKKLDKQSNWFKALIHFFFS